MHTFAWQTTLYYLEGKDAISKFEYCIVVCFLEFIIISNSNRIIKTCKNVRYFIKLSVEYYRVFRN